MSLNQQCIGRRDIPLCAYNIISKWLKQFWLSTDLHGVPKNHLLWMLENKSVYIFSPFLFSMFLNDIEDVFMNKGLSGIDVNFFKLLLILYADDKVESWK